jgi:exopolysaccharide biosynthesis polyprenyl glycosylphosphotransferase
MKRPSPLTLLYLLGLLAGDLVAFALAARLSYLLRIWNDPFAAALMGPFDRLQPSILAFSAAILGVFFLERYYLPQRGTSHVDLLFSVFVGVSKAMVVGLAINLLLQITPTPPRLMLLYMWLLGGLAIWLVRTILDAAVRLVRARGLDGERVLIVGAGEPASIVVDKIRGAPQLGYQVVGFVDVDEPGAVPTSRPLLGTLSDIVPLLAKHDIGEVIIAQPSLSHQQTLDLVSACARERVNVKVVPDVLQIMSTEVSTSDLTGLPMMRVRDISLRGWNLALKRTMDLALSALALVFLSPFLMLVALFVKLTSPGGPVFYTQERVGLDGRPFHLIKFRSMRVDAEADSGPVWASPDDERRTLIGRFIRRFSVDELPQLVNVLMGEMSLVGPRPERPHFVEQFRRVIPRYAERHNEKAGMTGWAQVNGLRGQTSIDERTKYDIFYVEHWSLAFDVKILLRTIGTVFTDRTAY